MPPRSAVTNVPITVNLLLTTGGTPPVARCQVSYTLDADGGLAGNQAGIYRHYQQ